MKHQVALWAGVAAFFSTILAIGAIDILDPGDRVQFLSGIVVGLITGGAVYAKQRLDDAKRNMAAGTLEVSKTTEGTTYSLEVEGDPELVLEGKDEVRFKVIHKAPEPTKLIPGRRKRSRTRPTEGDR